MIVSRDYYISESLRWDTLIFCKSSLRLFSYNLKDAHTKITSIFMTCSFITSEIHYAFTWYSAEIGETGT